MKTVFLRILEAEDKAAGLLQTIRSPEAARGRQRFDVDVDGFGSIPRSPFAYWISDDVRRLFVSLDPFGALWSTQVGASTKADFRFLRLWWEVPSVGLVSGPWLPFAKGGPYSPFYADVYLLILWDREPREIDALVCARYPYLKGNSAWVLHPESSYRQAGLTWSSRTKTSLSLRVLPAGCIFSIKGPAAVGREGDTDGLLAALAVGASSTFQALVEVQLAAADAKPGGAAHSYEIGIIHSTPIPPLRTEDRATLAALAHRGWWLNRSLDTHVEVSHAFGLPALLQVEGGSFAQRTEAWANRIQAIRRELDEVQTDLDALCLDLYGVTEADRDLITYGFGERAAGPLEDDDADDTDADDEDNEDESTSISESQLASQLVSWAVGVAIGRYDVRLATGDRPRPAEPDPFAPPPTTSPGMLVGVDGTPLLDPPADYPLSTSPVLVSDSGHGLDIASRVRAVFEVVFREGADSWWSDVGVALGLRSREVTSWLTKGFFDYHLRSHSRSRRKAPLLWPIGTKSGSYLVWFYAHRVTADSLFQVRHDLVGPKVDVEERSLNQSRQEAGMNPSAFQRKAIDAQQSLLAELRELQDELEALAPLWAPDLDDGTVVVLAPLWRLFAHHRAWSSELKKHWAKLSKGDYDWAHVAMHLWPERVVPKCAEDRSLAIAHGLEDVFWVQDVGHKENWHPRAHPTISVEQLIADRYSPAVAGALQRIGTS